MYSISLQGDKIRVLKKFSFGDVEGTLVEYENSQNVFVPDSLFEKIIECKKESERFISQITAERYVKALEALNRKSLLHVKDQSFLIGCLSTMRKGENDFTPKQRKTIEDLYMKNLEKLNELKPKRSKEDDEIPF